MVNSNPWAVRRTSLAAVFRAIPALRQRASIFILSWVSSWTKDLMLVRSARLHSLGINFKFKVLFGSPAPAPASAANSVWMRVAASLALEKERQARIMVCPCFAMRLAAS